MKFKELEEEQTVKPKKTVKEKEEKIQKVTEAKSRLGADAFVITQRNMARRYSSEKSLEEIIDWEFEKGNSYHCISQGDIDSLTYLRHIIKQQKIDTILLSTWCMSISDIIEIESWVNAKRINKVNFYLGEIFKQSYSGEYEYLQKMKSEGKCSITIFRNHSKVMAGIGDKFPFVIESSANVNTNPRCENTCITIDKGLADFYIDFYSQIISVDRDSN